MTAAALAVVTVESEPRILDVELAERLGMAEPRKVRQNLIEPNRTELESYGPLRMERIQSLGRPSSTYYLNEEQALLIVMFSRTTKAAEVRREVIGVFTTWRHGSAPEAATPVIPQTYAQALRLAADAEDARVEAQAALALAEQRAAALKPMADLGIMVASHKLTLMEVLATFHGVHLGRAQAALMDLGILRKQRGKFRVNRATHGRQFEEGHEDQYGSVDIFPNQRGRVLLQGLYRAGKLPMRKGESPRRLSKAIA